MFSLSLWSTCGLMQSHLVILVKPLKISSQKQALKFHLENSDELGELLYAGDKSFITANGKEMIRFRTGQRILFKARTKGGSRGFTGDKVFLDEAYDLPASAVGAMIPTLSTRPNPQVYYTSSAPHASSTVLHALRTRGMADDPSDQLFFAEWGNEEGVLADDFEAIRQANPGVRCGRISAEYIAREIRTFSGAPELVEEHSRERLGIADTPTEYTHVIDPSVWADATDPTSSIASHRSWALSVSPDRKWSTFGVAGRRADGRLHVEWLERKAGTAWVVDAGAALFARSKLPLRIHKSGPEGSFVVPLRERGVEVVEVSSADVAAATGQFIDAANGGTLRHLGQASLDVALRGAVLRTGADGAALWSQRNSSVEITPLMACTVAAGGVPVSEVKPVFAA